jgi:hypothetical protein
VAQHTRRVVWRDGNDQFPPKIYVTTTVNFGDKPAGCIAIAAVRETAEMFGQDSEAAWFLKNRTYVDDCIAGSNSLPGLMQISKEIEEIVAMGGFRFKETHVTGDLLAGGVPIKVLGLIWDTESDTLRVDIRVNFAGKRGGAKLAPDFDLEDEEFDENLPELITKRIIWRVAQGQYDPLGMLTPYTVQLKMVMRDMCGEEGKVQGWDDPAPQVVIDRFKHVISGLAELREISFLRTIQPSGEPSKPPMLLVFGDGSREAYCAVAYIRWELRDGSVECRLISCKSWVTPRKKISIPRIELMGSLMAVRLARKIRETFQFDFAETHFFTDSSAVLGMLHCDSVTFLEFVGNRVSEIKTRSNVKQWSWVPTDKNPADWGTRAHVEPADLKLGSEYQEGMRWMRDPPELWPIKKTFSNPPIEERRKELVTVASAKIVIPLLGNLINRSSKLTRTIRSLATVLMAVIKWRSYKRDPQVTHPVAGKYKSDISPEMLDLAEDYLICTAQSSLQVKDIQSLLPEKTTVRGLGDSELPIILVGGRSKVRYKIGYDQDGVPVLPSGHSLSRLYMREAHEVDHGGVNAAVMRSRNKVWIIQGAKLAKTIISKCYECKLRYKPLQGQKMAPFHSSRIGPAPIFSSVAVDLFGPLEFRDMVKKRVTGKGWGVMFVCTATTAIHIELTESYSTDSFLQALRRFVCMRGAPARIYSDRGTQLVQAAKEVAEWDFSEIQSWCAERKFTWELVPTGGQHMNGLAERMIGIVKKTLVRTLENRPCSFNELNTVLCEVALIINSRPIGIAGRDSDLEAGGPVTPLHLMLGRATAEAPRVVAGGFTPLNSRLQYVEEIRREFWNKFRAIVFQGLDRSYKWRREFRDLCTGDVVLLKDETAASASFKIARITRVFNSQIDGKVHRVIVQYKNPGEAVFRVSERPVQKVVLVVPVEEQDGGVGVELARPLPTTGVDAVGLLPVVGRGKEVIGSPPGEVGRPGIKVARPPPDEVGRGNHVARPPPWESDTGTRAIGSPLVWPGGGARMLPPGQEHPANQGQAVEDAAPGQENGLGPLAEDPPRAVSAAEEPAAVPPDRSNELAPSSRVGSDLSEPQESQGWAGRLRVPRDRRRPQRYQDPDLYKY